MAMQGYGNYPDKNLPPELTAEHQGLVRRQRIADAMLQRGMTPIQSSNPRSAVSWTQGLAQLANAYLGREASEDVEKGQAALGKRYQSGLADEVARVAALRQGRQANYDPQELEQSADQGNALPSHVGGDPRASVMAAMTSHYAPVREMGKMDFQADMRNRDAKEAQAARLHERQLVLEATAQNSALDRAAREKAAADANDIKLQIAELKADSVGQSRSPFYTFISTPNGIVAGNARDGTVAPVSVDGKPVMKAPDDPAHQGRVTAARTTGKATAERAFNMQGIGAAIKRAEDILGGKVKPTGSGLGTVVDKVGGVFGMNPTGSVEAQDLKAVAGALTAKMPRMEGPQSDRDVQLYRESAAEIGDSTVPIERRKRALETVKMLWQKYESQNPDAFDGGGATTPATAPAGVDPGVWAVMTPEERALWK